MGGTGGAVPRRPRAAVRGGGRVGMTTGNPQTPAVGPGAPRLLAVQVVAGALAAAVAAYVAVAWALTSGRFGGFPRAVLPSPLPGMLAATGALLLVAAPLVERRLLARQRQTPGGATAADRLDRYRTAKLVGFALREAAAVVGLVLALASGSPRWAVLFGAAAWVGMALGWPRARELPAPAAVAAPQPIEPG